MFSRFLEPYPASLFAAGRTIGISAAELRGAYRATKGDGGAMAMGTEASSDSLRGPRGRNQSKLGPRGIRRARGRRIELEGLEARTLLSVLPAATNNGPLRELTGFGDVTKQGNA